MVDSIQSRTSTKLLSKLASFGSIMLFRLESVDPRDDRIEQVAVPLHRVLRVLVFGLELHDRGLKLDHRERTEPSGWSGLCVLAGTLARFGVGRTPVGHPWPWPIAMA